MRHELHRVATAARLHVTPHWNHWRAQRHHRVEGAHRDCLRCDAQRVDWLEATTSPR